MQVRARLAASLGLAGVMGRVSRVEGGEILVSVVSVPAWVKL